MLIWIWPLLLLILGGSAVIAVLVDDPEKLDVSSESNCHDFFLQFNENLDFPPSRLSKLESAQNGIQQRLITYFGLRRGYPLPEFKNQGSYVMGSVIRKADDTCDVDMGIYFSEEILVTPKVLLQNIADALAYHTTGKVSVKSKCVRVYYSGNFHIDLPVYYEDHKEGEIYLAVKEDGWIPSDPQRFLNWYNENIEGNEQLVRVIRYLKAWVDSYKKRTGRKMPSGLALTIWAEEFYEVHDRDEVALLTTTANLLKELKSYVWNSWSCELPVYPKDDVTAKLKSDHKSNFVVALKEFVENGAAAIAADDLDSALNIWRRELGNWFPTS